MQARANFMSSVPGVGEAPRGAAQGEADFTSSRTGAPLRQAQGRLFDTPRWGETVAAPLSSPRTCSGAQACPGHRSGDHTCRPPSARAGPRNKSGVTRRGTEIFSFMGAEPASKIQTGHQWAWPDRDGWRRARPRSEQADAAEPGPSIRRFAATQGEGVVEGHSPTLILSRPAGPYRRTPPQNRRTKRSSPKVRW